MLLPASFFFFGYFWILFFFFSIFLLLGCSGVSRCPGEGATTSTCAKGRFASETGQVLPAQRLPLPHGPISPPSRHVHLCGGCPTLKPARHFSSLQSNGEAVHGQRQPDLWQRFFFSSPLFSFFSVSPPHVSPQPPLLVCLEPDHPASLAPLTLFRHWH